MKRIVVVVLCVLCLAACGKRGRLDFPEGAVYPRQYPADRQPEQGKMKKIVPASVGDETIYSAEKTND